MRHGKKHNHLGRTKAHRHALLRNLAIALVTHKRIKTTLAKAKALRVFIEPLVTKARQNTTHSRRVVFSYLQDKVATQELFGPIATKVGERPGGYVRVLHTGFRQGDSAEMALIEFVDFNEVYTNEKAGTADKQGAKRRSRRGGKSAAKAGDTVVETITPDNESTDATAPDEEKKED
jgi:large subunit ribosomal protein L17